MADYSHYGAWAQEWLEYAKSMPDPALMRREKMTLQELRGVENAQRESLARKYYRKPEHVRTDEILIPASDGSVVSTRLYRPTSANDSSALLPLYIHLHGGGWHYGSLDTEEPYCMNLCSSLLQASPPLEVAVLNVNYRHTPEFKFPSQQCDAWAAFSSFASGGSLSSTYKIDPKRILMGGTSAGAALSIATAIKDMRRQQQAVAQKDIQQISCLQGLILSSSPTVHPDLFPFVSLRAKEVSSYEQFQNSGVLPTPRARYFYNMYIAEDDEETSKRSERVSPLLIPNESWEPSFWPRTSIHVAGADAFRDEGILFAEKLQGLGIETKLRIHRGYPHAFERFPSLVESEKWRAQIVDDIKWLLG